MNFSERVRAAADAERQRRYEAARTRAELAEATRQKEVARLETELSKEAIEKGKEAEGAELVEECERRSDKQDLDELQVQDEEKSPKAVITLSPNGLLSRKRKRSTSENSSMGLFIDSVTEPPPTKKDEPLQGPTEPMINEEPKSVKDKLSPDSANRPLKEAKDDTKTVSAPTVKAPRPKKSAIYIHKEVVDTRRMASEWYRNIDTRQKFPRGDKATLDHVKVLIKNCIDTAKNNGNKERACSELRTKIHDMEVYKFLTPILVKKSKVLEKDGLLQIFDGPDKGLFPWDIAADAEGLWQRWMGGELDGFLLRGIHTTKGILQSGTRRISHRIDKAYTQRKSANVVGNNNLTNGQWWPSRICALRDGAHGEQEGGISGQVGKGAFSIVLSYSQYGDLDRGEAIEYCGTESKNSEPTRNTALLEESYRLKQPVRVLRSANKASKYAPKEGVRYDGLYEITDKEILEPKTAMMRFSLRRISGQDPIRYQGLEIRPTNQELKERMNIRKDLE